MSYDLRGVTNGDASWPYVSPSVEMVDNWKIVGGLLRISQRSKTGCMLLIFAAGVEQM